VIWIRALLAGILVPPILAGVYYFYLWPHQGANFNWRIFMVTVALAYWLVALLGIPAVIALRSRGSMRLGRVVACGATLGVVTALLVFGFSGLFPPIEQALIFGCMGAAAGLAAWWAFNPRNNRFTSKPN
jgi:hypothetical protein